MTYNDDTERHDGLRKLDCLGYGCYTVIHWIDTSPNGSKPESMGCKQDILCCSRAILNPIGLTFARQSLVHITANDNG